jgi:DNA-binding MarR family transcriptional regulator
MSTDRVANLLGALVTALGDRMDDAVTEEAGQQGRAPAALVQLADHPGLTVSDLRRRLGLTHSAVVRLVDRLVDRHLVTRTAHDSDARAVRLTLTTRGTSVATSVATARLTVLRDVLADLDPAQRDSLEQVAQTLLATLPTNADDTSLICRLCALRACPQDECPVEQRFRHFTD